MPSLRHNSLSACKSKASAKYSLIIKVPYAPNKCIVVPLIWRIASHMGAAVGCHGRCGSVGSAVQLAHGRMLCPGGWAFVCRAGQRAPAARQGVCCGQPSTPAVPGLRAPVALWIIHLVGLGLRFHVQSGRRPAPGVCVEKPGPLSASALIGAIGDVSSPVFYRQGMATSAIYELRRVVAIGYHRYIDDN